MEGLLRTFTWIVYRVLLLSLGLGVPMASQKVQSKSVHENSVTLRNYSFRIPADTDRHAGTIVSWPTKQSILGRDWSYPGSDVDATRREMAGLVKAIAKYEPVEVFVLDPTSDSQRVDGKKGSSYESAKKLLKGVANVTIHLTPNVDSLWARDTAPVFVHAAPNAGSASDEAVVTGMILHFNQWGQKNAPTVDSYFASSACDILKYSSVAAPFTGEGGCIDVDGQGTLLATESSLLNANRNPGVDKQTMEKYFAQVFGIEKTLWIPGQAGEDITDDHIDGTARFAPDGVVLVSKPFVPKGEDEAEYLANFNDMIELIQNETDARGRRLKGVALPEPDPSVLGLPADVLAEEGATVAYVNYHVVNGAVIVAKFGDKKADQTAVDIIAEAYPGYVIEQVPIRQLGIQGGGFHCATQQIPALKQ